MTVITFLMASPRGSLCSGRESRSVTGAWAEPAEAVHPSARTTAPIPMPDSLWEPCRGPFPSFSSHSARLLRGFLLPCPFSVVTLWHPEAKAGGAGIRRAVLGRLREELESCCCQLPLTPQVYTHNKSKGSLQWAKVQPPLTHGGAWSPRWPRHTDARPPRAPCAASCPLHRTRAWPGPPSPTQPHRGRC